AAQADDPDNQPNEFPKCKSDHMVYFLSGQPNARCPLWAAKNNLIAKPKTKKVRRADTKRPSHGGATAFFLFYQCMNRGYPMATLLNSATVSPLLTASRYWATVLELSFTNAWCINVLSLKNRCSLPCAILYTMLAGLPSAMI